MAATSTPPEHAEHDLPGDARRIDVDPGFVTLLPEPMPGEQRLRLDGLFLPGRVEQLLVWPCGPHQTPLAGFLSRARPVAHGILPRLGVRAARRLR